MTWQDPAFRRKWAWIYRRADQLEDEHGILRALSLARVEAERALAEGRPLPRLAA